MNVVSEIQLALEIAEQVTASITPDEWTAPTECEGWDVRAVLNHMVGGMQIFAAELVGGAAAGEHESDWLGREPLARLRAAVEADLAAWRRPDALAGSVTIGLGTLPGPMAAIVHLTELTVHTVDISVAVSRSHLLDEGLCGRLLLTMRSMGVDSFRAPGIFDPEVAVSPQALPHRQLAGYLGRKERVIV